MQSDGLGLRVAVRDRDAERERRAPAEPSAQERRELDGREWEGRRDRRGAALADCNPAPMPAAPPDGRCPRVSAWKTSCKAWNCPVCGPRVARNHQTKMGHNLGHLGGKFATIAITGPGADRLPWDEEWCKHRSGPSGRAHVHSGRRGCRVEQRPLREWCETLKWRWKNLRNSAQQETFRQTGRRVDILERVWEPQKRGVPHLHLVVPYGTFEEMHVADVFRDAIAQRARAHDFGNVQGKLNPLTSEEAARYLANYLAGRTGKKSSIRSNIADPRLPKPLVWESPALSSVSESSRMTSWRARLGLTLGTGITMRTLRRMRHLWACFKGVCDYYPRWTSQEEAVVTAAVVRRIAPARAGPLGDFAGALEWARAVDRRIAAAGGWRVKEWNPETQRVELPEDVCREITRLAFEVTRGATIEPVAA